MTLLGPAFCDELEKIAFSRNVTRLLQRRVGKKLRSGARPLSARTLLARHAQGTFKHKLAGVVLPTPKRPLPKSDVPSRDRGVPVATGENVTSVAVIQGPGMTVNTIPR